MSDYSPERAKGSFGIENRYTAEALFSRLTADNLPHSLTLDNTWKRNRRHNVDPILSLEVKVKSDLAKNRDLQSEDEAMVAAFKARMEVRTNQVNMDPEDLGKFFKKRGLDLEFKEIKDLEEAGLERKCFVSSDQSGKSVMIKFFDVSYGIYTMLISMPATEEKLTDLKSFTKNQKDFFTTLEDVMASISEMEGEGLPKTTLEFREKEPDMEIAVKCSFCNSLYSASQSFKCSECGASEPITKDGKVVYY